MEEKNRIFIDGNSLKIEDVIKVVFNKAHVALSEDKAFLEKLRNSRSFLEEYLEKGYPIYGVTTGFGDSCHNQINPKKTEMLQKSLVNFHGIGIGKNFSEDEARAVILIRLNSNIKGYSAIRMELVDLMQNFLNNNIAPVIPELGSVGASGDLTPLSYLAATLMGDRKVYYKGEITDTSEALKKEGLKPVVLQAKEGLALMNGTSVMTAVASIAWNNIHRLANISDFITAATTIILQGKDIPFRSKVSEIKNHSGQIKSAFLIHELIKDAPGISKYEHLLNKIGTIEDKHFKKHDIKIQDRYSIRCAPQINGVLRDTLDFTKTWIENEINSANDNPLIDAENEIIYNSGNFYGGHISCACDYLRVALANTADLSDKQAALIIDGKFNNLTENLIPHLEENSPLKGLLHGFKAAGISISALSSEIQFLTAPVSIHSRVTESLNQDKVSLGTISARKLRDQIELVYLQFSIHILAILQAIDLVGEENFSSKIRTIYKEMRKFTKFVAEDRPLDIEAEELKDFLKTTDLFTEEGLF